MVLIDVYARPPDSLHIYIPPVDLYVCSCMLNLLVYVYAVLHDRQACTAPTMSG